MNNYSYTDYKYESAERINRSERRQVIEDLNKSKKNAKNRRR